MDDHSDANDFTDLLSAAMSESGLIDLGESDVQPPANNSVIYVGTSAAATAATRGSSSLQNLIIRPANTGNLQSRPFITAQPHQRTTLPIGAAASPQIVPGPGSVVRMLRVPGIADSVSGVGARRLIIRTLQPNVTSSLEQSIALARLRPASNVTVAPRNILSVAPQPMVRVIGKQQMPVQTSAQMSTGTTIRLVPVTQPGQGVAPVRVAFAPRPQSVTICRPQILPATTLPLSMSMPGRPSLQVRPRLQVMTGLQQQPVVLRSVANRPLIVQTVRQSAATVGSAAARPVMMPSVTKAVVVRPSGVVHATVLSCQPLSPMVRSTSPSPATISSVSLLPSVINSPGITTSPAVASSAGAVKISCQTGISMQGKPETASSSVTSTSSTVSESGKMSSAISAAISVTAFSNVTPLSCKLENTSCDVGHGDNNGLVVDGLAPCTTSSSAAVLATSAVVDSQKLTSQSGDLSTVVSKPESLSSSAPSGVIPLSDVKTVPSVSCENTVKPGPSGDCMSVTSSDVSATVKIEESVSESIPSMPQFAEDDDDPFLQALMQLTDTNKKFEEEIAKLKAAEVTTTSVVKSEPPDAVSATPETSAVLSSIMSHNLVTGTSRPASPLCSVSRPGATVVRILPRSDSINAASANFSAVGEQGFQVPWSQPNQPSFTRPFTERGALSGFPAVFSHALNSQVGGIQSFASTIAALQPKHNHLSMSASSPNLQAAAAAAASKHVLVDENTGQVITTVLPPVGNNRAELRRINSIATGFSSVDNQFDEDEVEEEELGHAETYAEYMPAKLKFGCKHPDPVVETSSLSSVENPNIVYQMLIPEETIDYGYLSALQLETIVYACQKHETFLPSSERAGFLVGDGAGVGKGRTIAGIIYENYLHDRKRSLWLSVSNDLRVDAERDLRDIGASKIEVHPLNKFKYAKISSKVNGSVKKGVIFSTYSSLIGESQAGGKYRTRLKQLVHWLGKEFDGLIIFDECHRAKNLCPVGSSKPTKTGKTVVELQQRLPKARVVYASATGASEPRNMAYMIRLGLWGQGTPFPAFQDFIDAIEKRGVGAMELVAMDMKQRGMYIARQLSFHGVAFRIDEVAIHKDFVTVYNASVHLWAEAREKFEAAANLIDAEHRMRKTMWGQFWSAHQRFFKYLCISAKVKHCVQLANDAVKNGKCVVIGLQSTGESRTLEQLEECGGELNDFVSTALGVFQSLVEKHFPAPDRRKTFDLFGSSSSKLFDDSPVPSPASGTSLKRKGDSAASKKSDTKRAKLNWDTGSSSEDEAEKKNANQKSKSESSSSDDDDDNDDDDDDNNDSDDNSWDDSDSDSNPFAKGSDSDDDPWLKRSKKRKQKPPKEKKKPKPKKKKKDDDEDDEFDDIDKECDRALEEARKKATSSIFKPTQRSVPGMNAVEKANAMKKELLDKISQLGDHLPPNTLDELIDELGGPECVAEMTGRKGRVVSTKDGVQYESRSEVDVRLEIMNLTEKQRFMDGEKLIAIISEAASSGISLHADRRAINQRRRVHITLELPWSADRAIQQFGRTHRSNQVSAPEYIFLISQLAGEQRFASTVAKRLESLGALTHGDRRATETRDLSRFNIDNRYGRMALEVVMKCILYCDQHAAQRLSPALPDYHGNFLHDIRGAMIGVGLIIFENGNYSFDKDYNNISKFLNRILGIEVELQNKLFRYFTDTLTSVILQEKRKGAWDMGILDLGSSGETVTVLETKTYSGSFSGASTKISLNTVSVERGMNWIAAVDVAMDSDGPDDGFYLSKLDYFNKRKLVLLAVGTKMKKKDTSAVLSCIVYKPNTGRQPRMESFAEIRKKYRKVSDFDTARYHWEDLYDTSASSCIHSYMHGGCVRGIRCENGLRSRHYYILSGSVLSVWTNVERVLASRMQIIRLRTEDGKKIVGTLVPANSLEALDQFLSHDSNKNKSQVVVSGGIVRQPSTPGPSQQTTPGSFLSRTLGSHQPVTPGHLQSRLPFYPSMSAVSVRPPLHALHPLHRAADEPPGLMRVSAAPSLHHDKSDLDPSGAGSASAAHMSMPTLV